MGVDIAGLKPIVRSNEPVINFQDASDDAKKVYFEERNRWNAENPGVYFRASWWSWRPIVVLCESIIEKHKLNFDTLYWGSNDGAGLKTQEECNLLADKLEYEIQGMQTTMDLEDKDRIAVNLGGWTSIDGSFIDADTTNDLNETYPIGTVLLTSIITKDGTPVLPAHSTQIDHIKEFVKFLRECGGFQIY
jgi:hypothetical protein